MSRPLIILVGAIYAYISIESAIKGNYGLAIAFAGYAMGNGGMWMLAA